MESVSDYSTKTFSTKIDKHKKYSIIQYRKMDSEISLKKIEVNMNSQWSTKRAKGKQWISCVTFPDKKWIIWET